MLASPMIPPLFVCVAIFLEPPAPSFVLSSCCTYLFTIGFRRLLHDIYLSDVETNYTTTAHYIQLGNLKSSDLRGINIPNDLFKHTYIDTKFNPNYSRSQMDQRMHRRRKDI